MTTAHHASGRRALLLLGMVVSCGGEPLPSVRRERTSPVVETRPVPTSTASPRATSSAVTDGDLVYRSAELKAHAWEAHHYPPTACRLQALLGDADFTRLEDRIGYSPPLPEASDGGFTASGGVCPQPYCDEGFTWIHPDGSIVVAIHEGEYVDLFTNDPKLKSEPPRAVRQFLAALGHHDPKPQVRWPSPPPRQLTDPPSCQTPAIEELRRRFIAVDQRLRCDPVYSSFGYGMTLKDSAGAELPFYDSVSPETTRLGAVLRKGELVETGIDHASEPFVCAALTRRNGKRIVGWLRKSALFDLRHLGDAHPDGSDAHAKAIDSFFRGLGATPSWLTKTERQFGDLRIKRSASAVHLDLSVAMAGHHCGFDGPLNFMSPRLLIDPIDDGCDVDVALFDNGVFVWENGCAGMRATCDGPYVRRLPQ